ncbi:hypothetical protein L21SP2_2023 [Salinispira pacifica]|uniref:Uncharacterized protein n=2 Tax=Salinispira pacifica TaxID=1307761 RepID=V5WIK3_9SPIO|nr:hypothetical protein L21SP2_2023 [Salinispira pacifica]
MVLVAVFLVASVGSCALFNPVTEEQASEAFGISYSTYVAALFTLGFGGSLEGASIDEETGTITLEEVDLVELYGTEAGEYTLISGTYEINEDGSLEVSNTFEGGPVKTLSYTVSEEFLNTETGELTVTANGKTFELVDFSL